MKKMAQISLFPQVLSSPLRWSGGKSLLMPELLNLIPPKFNDFYDLFSGSISFTLELFNAGKLHNGIHINDINTKLINVYTQIRDNPEELIDILSTLKEFWEDEEMTDEGEDPLTKEAKFFGIKQEFNGNEIDVYTAGQFIFLNSVCFNGLYRENKKGEFNVPIGKDSHGNYRDFDYDEENILQLAEFLARCDVTCEDYREIQPQRRDFVYLDPPYYPIKQDSFVDYNSTGFASTEHALLSNHLHYLDNRGIKFMMSNSDCPATREMFKEWNITTVTRNNSISGSAKGRGKTSEIVVMNY